MAWVDPAGPVEGEFGERGAGVGLYGSEEEGDVVAKGVAGLDGGGEPVVAVVEDGETVGAFLPGAVGELVCVVAGLTAEELGQLGGGGGDEVNGNGLRLLGEAGGAVLVRKADEEPSADRYSTGWRSRLGSRRVARRGGW